MLHMGNAIANVAMRAMTITNHPSRIANGRVSVMDLRSTPEQELLRRTVREFAEAEIRPHVMEWDEAQAFPADAAAASWPRSG